MSNAPVSQRPTPVLVLDFTTQGYYFDGEAFYHYPSQTDVPVRMPPQAFDLRLGGHYLELDACDGYTFTIDDCHFFPQKRFLKSGEILVARLGGAIWYVMPLSDFLDPDGVASTKNNKPIFQEAAPAPPGTMFN